MAITYNNLYLDIRQQFLRAGLPDPTLESRELVCCASGKSREELSRDGRLYVPDTASGEKGDPVPGISSILKSCGRSTVRQELSSKPGCSALASPR